MPEPLSTCVKKIQIVHSMQKTALSKYDTPFLNTLLPISGITSEEGKLFCRAWIWIHPQIIPRPSGSAGLCHCSALILRTESSLQWLTGRKKAIWKGKKHLPQTSPHLGEHHTSPMHGGEGSRWVGGSNVNSCWWPGWQLTKLAKPHLALTPGRAREIRLIPSPLAASLSICEHHSSTRK